MHTTICIIICNNNTQIQFYIQITVFYIYNIYENLQIILKHWYFTRKQANGKKANYGVGIDIQLLMNYK